MAKIVVDLTPVLPGGENGGAKLMVLELIKQLGKIATKDNFILLTAEASHAELATLDTKNIRRLCVVNHAKPHQHPTHFFGRGLAFLKRKLVGIQHRNKQKTILEELKPDLFFCPFTAPFFSFPGVPVVSIIYDLQYLEYPNFFSISNQIERGGHFKKACETASRLICISEFTRQSVLKYSPVPLEPERVITVPIFLPTEWTQKGANGGLPDLLKQYDLIYENFLLYPANFWKHKNHKMLLTAFAMYRAKHPDSTLKLVCTGAPGEGRDAVIAAAESMNLTKQVVFPGYISSDALFNLLLGCKALMFPSLYEGFGIPVIEAMLLGKLVLCSDKGSLPEVGGEAAMYFNPGKPKEMVSIIEEVEQNFDKLGGRIIQGYAQALQYLGTEKMAKAYYDIFQEAMRDKKYYRNVLHGVFEDGWSSEKISLGYVASKEDRVLNMTLHCPLHHPKAPINVIIKDEHSPEKVSHTLQAGETLTIKQPISKESGYVEILIKEIFQPAQCNMGEDVRVLGCVFQGYDIVAVETVDE